MMASSSTSMASRPGFKDTDTQLKAKDILEKAFNPDPADPQYVVALNLLAASPTVADQLHALPMYLGLDLRGGVHFLLQVDMKGALTKRLDSISADLRTVQCATRICAMGALVVKASVWWSVSATSETRDKARNIIADSQPDLLLTDQGEGSDLKLVATLKPQAQLKIGEFALKQNITTLHNRINELGVAEPVIQQQGTDRIVVQLPGVQDTAKAKDILGRTATLEIRMVDDSPGALEAAIAGNPPFGTEVYNERGGQPLLVKMPDEIVEFVERMLRSWQRLDRGRMQCELIGVKPGDEFELSREHVLTGFETKHTVPSRGYIIWERRRKLKPEYVGLSGDQIRDLRYTGIDVSAEVRTPLVCYCGDTAPEGLDADPAVYQSKILITEMTFFRPEHRRDKIHKFGHTHLDDLVERADQFQNELIILGHFSTRYSDRQVQNAINKRLPDHLKERVKLWC
jgi:ribonuclease BN (tRNA processing enzyme)